MFRTSTLPQAAAVANCDKASTINGRLMCLLAEMMSTSTLFSRSLCVLLPPAISIIIPITNYYPFCQTVA